MVLLTMKCETGSTKRFVARFAALRVCIAQLSTAITAFLCGVSAAGIADHILNTRHFDNSTLHALAFYFNMRGTGKGEVGVGKQKPPLVSQVVDRPQWSGFGALSLHNHAQPDVAVGTVNEYSRPQIARDVLLNGRTALLCFYCSAAF